MQKDTQKKKTFNGKYQFCFIGNLNDSKGVGRIIDAFKEIKSDEIGAIHFIGDGPMRKVYEQQAEGLPVRFHGYLLREEISTLLPHMHFLLLPSDSEGFPKVVAESASYGIIPIVSAISSLPQYIQDGKNGFLIDNVNTTCLVEKINSVLSLNTKTLKRISLESSILSGKFTYSYYNKRIIVEILTQKNIEVGY